MNRKLRDEKNPVLWPSTTVTFVPPYVCNVSPPIWSLPFIPYLRLNKAVSVLFIHAVRAKPQNPQIKGI